MYVCMYTKPIFCRAGGIITHLIRFPKEEYTQTSKYIYIHTHIYIYIYIYIYI